MRLFLFLFLLLSEISAHALENLVIQLGRSQTLSVSKNSDIRVTNSAILSVVDRGHRVDLIAKKSGESLLLVGAKRYKIQVLPPGKFTTWLQLKKITAHMQGLQVTVENKKIYLEGQIHFWRDWIEIAEAFAAKRKLSFHSRVHIDSEDLANLKKYFQQRVRSRHLPLPKLRLNSPQRVTIPQSQKKYHSSWQEIFHPFGIDIFYENSKIPQKPLVRVHVTVAEVSRSYSKTLGIQWPSSWQATVVPKLRAENGLELIGQFIESSGQGQVLASPVLLSRSGTKASFLAGGEIPIQLLSERTAQVTWKKHGVLLEVHPDADWSGHLSVKITCEVSMLDFSKTYNQIPGLSAYKVSTHFDLRSGQTIALSGLLKSDLGENQSGLPYLSSIPIIGPLFQSRNFRDQKSELIIFVTPKLIDPNQENYPKFPKGWRTKHERSS